MLREILAAALLAGFAAPALAQVADTSAAQAPRRPRPTAMTPT